MRRIFRMLRRVLAHDVIGSNIVCSVLLFIFLLRSSSGHIITYCACQLARIIVFSNIKFIA